MRGTPLSKKLKPSAIGINRLRFPALYRVVPVRCLGSVNSIVVADAVQRGFDGVLLLGCRSGEDYQCHFIQGSELLGRRMDNVRETMGRLALEEDRVKVVETSIGQEALTYLQGRRQIVPGVEQACDGLEPGASLEIVVSPAEAYGDRDPAGVFVVPRAAFPADETIGPGMLFSAHRPDGKNLTFRVVEANDESVLGDTNHPLAGETLHISVLVHEVRNASAEEIYAGRPFASVHVEPQYLA